MPRLKSVLSFFRCVLIWVSRYMLSPKFTPADSTSVTRNGTPPPRATISNGVHSVREAGVAVSPLRISYRTSLLLIRTSWLNAWVVAVGRLPQYLEQLAGDTVLLVLPAR